MPTKIEIVVNVVGQGTSGASATDTLIQTANSGTSRYEIVNNLGQVVASVTGIIPILAPIGLQTNTLAGTMTFLKIMADIKDGKSINTGDVLNLVGNVAGIVGTVTVLLSGPPGLILLAGGVSILAGSAGIITADGGLKDWTTNFIRDFWPSRPVIDLNPYWIDTEGRARRYTDIKNDPNSGFSLIIVKGNSCSKTKGETPPTPRPVDVEEVDGDGQM